MPIDGISRLVAVTQMKSATMNDEALAHRSDRAQSPGINDRTGRQNAAMELQYRLRTFRQTLTPAAAALLDQWLAWAGEHH